MATKINFFLNGEKHNKIVEDYWTLIYFLREELSLTGTKEGCGSGECGSCTVLVDNEAVNACIFLAVEINNKKIVTIEGLSDKVRNFDPVQVAFVENGGVQCGFCTPGMIMSVKALLYDNNNPSETDIKNALAGNICRCTGYKHIIDSIKSVVYKK